MSTLPCIIKIILRTIALVCACSVSRSHGGDLHERIHASDNAIAQSSGALNPLRSLGYRPSAFVAPRVRLNTRDGETAGLASLAFGNHDSAGIGYLGGASKIDVKNAKTRSGKMIKEPLSAKPALLRRAVSPTMTASASKTDWSKTDWSFLDAAYLITCPNKDGTNPRLNSALEKLEAVGLSQLTEVREFGTDDEDRIRGCYTSHISVLQEAAARFADRPAGEDTKVLVLEDNLSMSPRIAQETLDEIAAFLSKPGSVGRVDMVHLAYIMYVPGLSVERIEGQDHVVRLKCNADSVLGTTAYVISGSGLDTLLAEHQRTGYVDAIPNMMARLFPDTRYAAYPMPLHRAAKVKSLVNGQLDTLRAGLFLPAIYTKWEDALVKTGLSTSVLFPALLMLVLLVALGGISEVIRDLFALSRGEDINLVLPLISSIFSGSALFVLMYGLSLAPKPQFPPQV